MVRPDIVTLVNRETQTSNTAVYKKDLPKAGGISAIDINVRMQNAGTAYTNKDLLDAISRIELIFNGTDRRLSLTGPEMFRLGWLKTGSPLAYNWDQTPTTGYPEVKLRYMPGRYIGDPQYGIDLSRFNNVQLNIDYDLTEFGTAGTHFTTGSFSPSVLLHMFQPGNVPSFRGMIGQREIWNYTSVGGDVHKDVDLPSSHPVCGIGIFAMEDNVAEGTDITEVIIGKDQYRTRWVDGYWYNLQPICNENLDVREEIFKLVATDDQVLDTHLANIKNAQMHSEVTSFAANASGSVNVMSGTLAAGNRITLKGETVSLDGTAADNKVTHAAISAATSYLKVTGDVHGALYFPFGKPEDNFVDALMPADLQSAQVRLLDAAAGAYTAVVVEEIYS